jgi:hypothetical protein
MGYPKPLRIITDIGRCFTVRPCQKWIAPTSRNLYNFSNQTGFDNIEPLCGESCRQGSLSPAVRTGHPGMVKIA